MNNQYTAAEVQEILASKGLYFDKVYKSRKFKGAIVVQQGFFYRHGMDQHQIARKIKKAFEDDIRYDVSLVDAKEVWQQWPKDSYWEVVFTFSSEVGGVVGEWGNPNADVDVSTKGARS